MEEPAPQENSTNTPCEDNDTDNQAVSSRAIFVISDTTRAIAVCLRSSSVSEEELLIKRNAGYLRRVVSLRHGFSRNRALGCCSLLKYFAVVGGFCLSHQNLLVERSVKTSDVSSSPVCFSGYTPALFVPAHCYLGNLPRIS